MSIHNCADIHCGSNAELSIECVCECIVEANGIQGGDVLSSTFDAHLHNSDMNDSIGTDGDSCSQRFDDNYAIAPTISPSRTISSSTSAMPIGLLDVRKRWIF